MLLEPRTFQGASKMTKAKEEGIKGVTYMRINQFKSSWFKSEYRRVIVADIFCGSGRNVVEDEQVDGSPVRILQAYNEANNAKLHGLDFDFWFSDIKKSSCESLEKYIEQLFGIRRNVSQMSACNAVNHLGNILAKDKTIYLLLVVDPNGPKDFPKEELEHLIRAFPNRVDVAPYISATTINRCIGANRSGRDFTSWWIGSIENLNEGFIHSLTYGGKRNGWIREPIQGDKFKWTLIPTFGCMKPRFDWSKNGYVEIKSDAGRKAIEMYCGRFN